MSSFIHYKAKYIRKTHQKNQINVKEHSRYCMAQWMKCNNKRLLPITLQNGYICPRTNAKCRHLKKFTSKGTLLQVFVCLSPPPHP